MDAKCCLKSDTAKVYGCRTTFKSGTEVATPMLETAYIQNYRYGITDFFVSVLAQLKQS